MISLHLSRDEATFLNEQLRRHLLTIDNELVHTDVHRMQRELATDLERLRAIADRLLEAIAYDDEVTSAEIPLAP